MAWAGTGCNGDSAAPEQIPASPPGQPSAGVPETVTEHGAVKVAAPHVLGGSQIVSAGATVQSVHYQMVFTLGQPTQNQEMSKSPSYQLQGGLVGPDGRLK